MTQPVLSGGELNAASPSRAFGRLTGLLYLIAMIGIGLVYGYSQTLSGPDAAISVNHSARNEIRLFVASGALALVCYLLAALAFYRLFRSTSRAVAVVLVLFVATSVPLSMAALANMLDLASLSGEVTGLAPSLNSEQLQQAAARTLATYNSLILMSALFWGLWLVPLGYLVYRSRVAPRALGLCLIFGSLFYFVSFAGSIFAPGFEETEAGQVVSIATFLPAAVGELGTVAWLIIFGGRLGKA